MAARLAEEVSIRLADPDRRLSEPDRSCVALST